MSKWACFFFMLPLSPAGFFLNGKLKMENGKWNIETGGV
jgi:hypothetical protein